MPAIVSLGSSSPINVDNISTLRSTKGMANIASISSNLANFVGKNNPWFLPRPFFTASAKLALSDASFKFTSSKV